MTNFDNGFTSLKLRNNSLSLKSQILKIKSLQDFNTISLKVFKHQFDNNRIYQQFCRYLSVTPEQVKDKTEIPFLPIEFFKTHQIKTGNFKEKQIFLSSGTTGENQSKHFVKDLNLYEDSYQKSFYQFYGDIKDYCVLALLPSYSDREGSSLIYMVKDLINKSKHSKSGFFLENQEEMIKILKELVKNNQKTILIGVSFALLNLAEQYKLDLNNVIIMETGGMKGRRKEITREELHKVLKSSFNVSQIHSEYGMTELLSQAYSTGNGVFKTPIWMKIIVRDMNDPFSIVGNNKSGGINIIDLANIDSCSFVSTQDLGKMNSTGEFEILGRFDNSDLRGCNLLTSI